MVAGFCAAAIGDWLLAVKGCPKGTPGFLGGVAAFSLAQLIWTLAHVQEARPNPRVFTALAVPLSVFVGVRLWPVLTGAECVALSAYALIGPFNVAMAYVTRRRLYLLGACLLVASDAMIGMRWLRLPGAEMLVGPLYIASELAMLVSCLWRREWRFGTRGGETAGTGAGAVALAGGLFVFAAHCFPGGYNPCMRMLSALGRTEVRLVEYPWCHSLFSLGMCVSILGIARMAPRLGLSPWGTALNLAGLGIIALIPENVSEHAHNAGCWLAAIGGGVMLLGWLLEETSQIEKRVWAVALVAPLAAIGLGLVAHACGLVPFAPWVPTAQKLVIGSYAAWLFHLATRRSAWRARASACFAFLLPVLLGCLLFGNWGKRRLDLPQAEGGRVCVPARVKPLSDDERAGLLWLEDVTGPHDAARERGLWNIGGSQHGIFAKRYNLAFAGYAAVALGLRGDGEARARVGRILGNCIRRMIKADVWGYSQSKNYWGRKPWAPDPCYRENVMYTGHLLQLLAYYELVTGDRRYHRDGGGWDFVWKDGRRVHYDVEKLIAVTVEQMRKGPNGGITCEPGLMFFACNNHPHVALAVFSKLGYGDWSKDADRWEKWALDHYLSPKLGGGALNFLYHVRGNFFYPRGQNAFDGWSLLWYAAWASNPERPRILWGRAREKIDWESLTRAEDVVPGGDCCDPQPVSPAVTAVFLAAAARACGDAETAVRLETSVDERHLRRQDGRLFLDLNRDWRIGATAMRLISLAESRGFRFADAAEIWYTDRDGLEDVRGAGDVKGPRKSGSNY